MEWIAGDIGGTKSWLAWVAVAADGTQRLRFERSYASAGFASAEALVRRFRDDAHLPVRPDALILAVPGPLQAQCVRLTNLDWMLDAADLQAALDIADVQLVNDFEAAAAGVATLEADDLLVLNPQPVEAGAVRAITGAGTGLGLAFMLDAADGAVRCFATEGGHADFAPADARQTRLLEWLRARHGHVSWERVASGSALPALHAFCCAERGIEPPAGPRDGAWLAAAADAGDALADSALDLFVDLYGAWVGNVALLFRPRAGLYLAGGVAVHLQARMRAPRFLAAATNKGRMRGEVERTPIFLITSGRLGVQGALALGASRLRAPHAALATQ